jgi:N6-L-threonylcarbamoyladenine synthase
MSAAGLVLGIESSCDDLAAAVVRGGREILASVVRSQNAVHAPYGGVVPELASRDHVRGVSEVTAEALARAGVAIGDLDGIAVTAGPGLVGSLLVGLSFAKALAFARGLPLVGVHHLVGHLVSAELADATLAPPYLGFVVSGGHTALYRVSERGVAPELLGETLDDAAGEAFDKVAVLLGLPFPGGPALSRAAERGRADTVPLPVPMHGKPGLDFSFSGLKTAVSLAVAERAPLTEQAVSDIAASFEAVAVEALVAKARRALRGEGLGAVAVVGGVAANLRLRAELARAGERDGFRAVFPPAALCTDNAAMIAAAGALLLERGVRHGPELDGFSRVPVASAAWPTAGAPPKR